MANSRETTRRHFRALINAVLNGDTMDDIVFLAIKGSKHLKESGTYVRKFDNETERVLHRHLNLYRNKFTLALKPADKARWAAKIEEQKAKIAEYEGRNGPVLDLDGL